MTLCTEIWDEKAGHSLDAPREEDESLDPLLLFAIGAGGMVVVALLGGSMYCALKKVQSLQHLPAYQCYTPHLRLERENSPP